MLTVNSVFLVRGQGLSAFKSMPLFGSGIYNARSHGQVDAAHWFWSHDVDVPFLAISFPSLP